MQRELSRLANYGIELEVVQNTASIGNKNSGGSTLPLNNTNIPEVIMSNANTTTAATSNNPAAEPTNEHNWPLHVEARLARIGQELERQNSTSAVVRGALVTTGAVVVGSLTARGLWQLGSWLMAPKPTAGQ